MPSPLKKTVKNETYRPFALASENAWKRIAYRFDDAEPWQNALQSPFVVLPSNREDVRSDVLHAFEIEVDTVAVQADGIDLNDVTLVVLARDSFAKEILTFANRELASTAHMTINVSKDELRNSSMSARIDFHVMLAARTEIRLPTRTIRRGGRLAAHVISVSAERQGHSFNFAKTTPAEFAARDLPKTTTFHVDIPRSQDLIEACDDISGVLSVLVHEDAWSTLQDIRSGDKIGESLGAMFLTDVIYAVLIRTREALVSERRELEDGSVGKRLLSWLADKERESVARLEQLLTDADGLLVLHAMLQDSLKVTPTIQKVRLEEDRP